MSPDNQTYLYTTTSKSDSIAGSGHPSTSYEAEAIEEDWMDFFDFDAYERDISGHPQRYDIGGQPCLPFGSSSFEPPTTPSFSLLTITEHGKAPATPAGGSLIPARDKDAHLEFGVNSLAGQEQESGEDIDVAPSTANVLSAAVSRADTLTPFEPTPVDSPGNVPTLKLPERVHDTSTQQTEPS
ncbi:hypothetical protein B0T13DRAFT_485421 [Neurospora crassa]|nr:hypothetical protein B0T13DRAFT_485421 [Neurospora crassa]